MDSAVQARPPPHPIKQAAMPMPGSELSATGSPSTLFDEYGRPQQAATRSAVRQMVSAEQQKLSPSPMARPLAV